MYNQLVENKYDFKERVKVAIYELECPAIHMMEINDFIKSNIIKQEFDTFKAKIENHLLNL